VGRNLRLKIAYDGTGFVGWQRQKNGATVQGEIEKRLSSMLREEVNLIGSGRTDSGVHAREQIANFRSENHSIPAAKFREALNSTLPQGIQILESVEVPWDFHSRFDACEREYRYYIHNAQLCPLEKRPYCHHLRRAVDISLLNSLATEILGRQDFSVFTAAGDPSPSKVREVYTSCFYRKGDSLIYAISANAFLWRMVRSITGTLLDLELKKASPQELRDIIQSKERSKAGVSAPAKGLFLHKIWYAPRSRYREADSAGA
jgi:tRNA pseudouridine38-40 synthase